MERRNDRKMGLTTRQIVEFYNGLFKRMDESPRRILLDMVVESLSPQQRKVYAFVYDNKNCTSQQIANALHISINSACNRLNELYSFDLVLRHEERNESGLYYKWEKTKR